MSVVARSLLPHEASKDEFKCRVLGRIKLAAIGRMHELSASRTLHSEHARLPPSPSGYLLELLLADVVTHVEVVRRELSLSEAMVERLQRAVDRLHCAQAILEAEGRRRFGNSDGEHWTQLGEAVRLLAESWPQEYPEGAVEWRLLGTPRAGMLRGQILSTAFHRHGETG
jgi:hypothetical protein